MHYIFICASGQHYRCTAIYHAVHYCHLPWSYMRTRLSNAKNVWCSGRTFTNLTLSCAWPWYTANVSHTVQQAWPRSCTVWLSIPDMQRVTQTEGGRLHLSHPYPPFWPLQAMECADGPSRSASHGPGLMVEHDDTSLACQSIHPRLRSHRDRPTHESGVLAQIGTRSSTGVLPARRLDCLWSF